MTEAKIKELQELLHRREVLKNEMEKFDELFLVGRENIGYEIVDTRSYEGKNYIHFIKDHHGYLAEALRKIYDEYLMEMKKIQEEIANI